MDLYPQFDIQNVARAVYGDGIDGVGAFDGVSAVAGFGLVGSVYTQTRDVFLSEYRVHSGITVKTAGFRTYCSGTGQHDAGSVWSANGNAGVLGVAGAATAIGTTGIGLAGGAGSAGVGAGTAGTNQANGVADGSGAGGAGGAGGADAGGAGGTYAASILGLGGSNTLVALTLGMSLGTADGAASGVGGNGGGGGGGGGGLMNIGNRAYSGTGTLSVAGGKGSTTVIGTGAHGVDGAAGHINHFFA